MSQSTQSFRNPLAGGLVALAVVGFLAGCNSTNGYLNNTVGMSAYKSGNYTLARDEFQRAVYNNPRNASYMHNLAAAMKKQGDAAAAEQTLRKALVTDPQHQPTYHSLAMLLKEQNRSPEAIDLMQGWSDQQPYNSDAQVELAWIKRESGDMAGAEQALQQALRVKPNDPIATAQLGQLYQDTNQPERAVAMYRRSLYTRWYQPQVQSRLSQLERNGVRSYASNQPLAGPGSGPTMSYTQSGSSFAQFPLPSYSHLNTFGTSGSPTLATGMPTPANNTVILGGDPAHSAPNTGSAALPVVAPQ